MRKVLLSLILSVCLPVAAFDPCTDAIEVLKDLAENYMLITEEIDLQITLSMGAFNMAFNDIDRENARIQILRWIEHKMLLLTLMEGSYSVCVDLYPDKMKSWEEEMKELERLHKLLL